jgi:hypothetical protein
LHNTFADAGIGDSGQGVCVGEYVTLTFTNTIIAGHHSVGVSVTAASVVSMEGTLWHNNGAKTGGAGTIALGTIDLTGDPAFGNPPDGDYHIRHTSAAIDEGIDARVRDDIDREVRPEPSTNIPDLGADEFHCITVNSASITGPLSGEVSTPYSFQAIVVPPNATYPAFTWSGTPESGQGTPNATYRWAAPGTYTVTVTIDNCGGSKSASHPIKIGYSFVYLPIILRNH